MRTTGTGSAARIHASFAAFAVLAIAFTPLAARAQQSLEPVQVRGAGSRIANPQADALAREAEGHYATPKRWREAARLHRRAAELHGEDPQAVPQLRMAAWLYSASRDFASARTMMERAGERAAAVGDIDAAAHAYVDAALFAIDDGREDRLPGLVQRARVLADAPLLPEARRAAILQRIDGAPRLASIARAN